MRYRVGDKLLCKADIYWANGKRIFTGGQYYDIKKFRKNRFGDMEVIFECDVVYTDNGKIQNNFNRVTEFPWTDKRLKPDVNYYIRNCFYHFYTKQEMRKMKLDKINEL